MLGFIQKILLLIITLTISVLFSFLSYSLFVDEGANLNFENLVPPITAISGLLSFVFHIKTIKFHKIRSLEKLNFTENRVFWIFNLVFVLVLFFFITFSVFQIVKLSESANGIEQEMTWIYTTIVLVPLFICLWLFFDMRFIYLKKIKLETKAKLNSIEEIKGAEKN